jgi:hypothetical protein
MVDNKTINRITTISSTIRTPKTTLTNCIYLTPISSKARIIIVVDELASIPPNNKLSITDHCNHRPSKNPDTVMKPISTNAVIDAAPPTRNNFLKLNSKPKPNSK